MKTMGLWGTFWVGILGKRIRLKHLWYLPSQPLWNRSLLASLSSDESGCFHIRNFIHHYHPLSNHLLENIVHNLYSSVLNIIPHPLFGFDWQFNFLKIIALSLCWATMPLIISFVLVVLKSDWFLFNVAIELPLLLHTEKEVIIVSFHFFLFFFKLQNSKRQEEN